MFLFINLLKVIGICLIVNSHMDNVYPISSLAAGGAVGNAIFFAASGFCLYNIRLGFKEWYFKRVIRIMPTVWIVSIIILLTGFIKVKSFASFVHYFIYPTRYWFIGGILIFYAIYYVIAHLKFNKYLLYILAFVSIITYGINYYMIDTSTWIVEDNIVAKYIFYFWTMIIGALVKKKIQENKKLFDSKLWQVITLFLLYFVVKILVSKMPGMMPLQFITQVITYPLIYLTIIYFYSKEAWLNKIGNRFKKSTEILINKTSQCTLEIYLVHIPVIYYFRGYQFPVNLLIILAVTFAGVIALKYLGDRIHLLLERRQKNWALQKK